MADPAVVVATSVHHNGGTAVAFSPDARWVATAGFDRRTAAPGSADGTVFPFDTTTGATVLPVLIEGTVGTGPTQRVVRSPDGRRIAAGGADGVTTAAAENGLARTVLSGAGAAHALAYDPTGPWLAAGLADGTVRGVSDRPSNGGAAR